MKVAKAYGRDLEISTKNSVEVCNLIRNKTIEKARKLLEDVVNKKTAVPYRRYNKEIPHRKGNMASGRYPIKTINAILKILKNAEDNAQNIGLDSPLIISHISASKAAKRWHFGRWRRRRMKNTHIRVELSEKKK